MLGLIEQRCFAITGRRWHTAPDDLALLDIGRMALPAALFGPRAAPPRTTRATTDDDESRPDAAALNDKLGVAFVNNPRLQERWECGTVGLSDTGRSGRDMSVVAMLV